MLGCRGLGVRGPDPRPGVPAQQPAGELRGEDAGHGGPHPQAGGAARTRQGQRGMLAGPLERATEFRGSFHNIQLKAPRGALSHPLVCTVNHCQADMRIFAYETTSW